MVWQGGPHGGEPRCNKEAFEADPSGSSMVSTSPVVVLFFLTAPLPSPPVREFDDIGFSGKIPN